ncbi:MAG: amidohydrolase family protein [Pirellulales bacterium]
MTYKTPALAIPLVAALACLAHSAVPGTPPPAGLRENTPRVYALTGGRIVVSPGQVIESGTLIVRDGVIEAVGGQVEVPSEAVVRPLDGKTVYAGFIDALAELPADASRLADGKGAGYWNADIAPTVRVDERYALDPAANKQLRSQGITARLLAPSLGIVRGTSAVVATSDESGARAILKPQAALHLTLTASRGRDAYPNSPMGAMALARQAFHDAAWYESAWNAYRQQPGLPRPEHNDALAALAPYRARTLPVVISASDELYFLRADQFAREFNLDCIIRGCGAEYRRLEAVKAAGRPVILPVNFPKPPNVLTPEAAMSVALERLLHWDIAPENPARLDAAGVKIAFTTHGLSDVGGFLSAIRKAVQRGLNPDRALAALTVTPAELFGLADRLGTLEAGKAANLVIADGDLFQEKTRLLETWVDGRPYLPDDSVPNDLRGTWSFELATPDGGSETILVELEGEPAKLSGKVKRADKEAQLIHVVLDGSQLAASFKGETVGWTGVVQFSGSATSSETRPGVLPAIGAKSEATWTGVVVWADGKQTSATARRTAPFSAKPDADEKKPEQAQPPAEEAPGQPMPAAAPPDGQPAPTPPAPNAPAPAAATTPEPDEQKPKTALYPVNYPLGAFGLAQQPEQPAAVVFEHATVWTAGPAGTLDDASVLVEQGRITAVGKDVAAPAGAVVIDATNKHITPGIIDCHSHIATDGGVNESGQTITAEVRIGDFIDPNDVNIYRQLAGGVTAANILHGSANTIGGQNQVLKFRWGALPEEMKFAAATPGIKFALGENVKQSNWGDQHSSRYPQTRMGVEQLVHDAFRAARDYRQAHDAFNQGRQGIPPRIDLELEALAEVLEGKRLIHCHSYRQDEILAFLRTCEQFGVRVGTLQHILEGYKLADAIAGHGAGASSFSDWWAYKFEVFDAIPYNGALMHRAGVVVSFNSDNAELGRRLNLEAAKAVRYGGVPPHDALQFVTLNPARQLGIAERVGSLEPGKDADLVVWSGSPLSSYSRAEQTWIDGRKYFDREHDQSRRDEAAAMRAALVQRVLASGEAVESPDEARQDPWPREDIFCHHGHDDTDE